jgi:TRAP transporter 4TM/12TM fusion protein
MEKRIANVALIVALSMSVFHLYTAFTGSLDALLQRSIHLGFVFTLTFLTNRGKSKVTLAGLLLNLACIAAGILVTAYVIVDYYQIISRTPFVTPLASIQYIYGILVILLVLETARRNLGWPLPVLALVFLVYSFLGPYMPGILAHRGVSLSRLIDFLCLGTDGIFGTPLGVSATYVFLFILFGSFLNTSGIGEIFMKLSTALLGHVKGGPGIVAVVSSALFGSISGSAVANVVGTGSFTIPMMKKVGFKKEYAGAVEAVASTGGQIMPPVMGAAAFIVAEIIGIPYVRLCLHAMLPAVLYFFAVGVMVYLGAAKQGWEGLPRNELPSAWGVLREGGHMFLPIVVIVGSLISGYTAIKAGLYGLISVVILSMLKQETRMSMSSLLEALEEGAKTAMPVASACACAGIVIGVVMYTGLGIRFGSILMWLSGGEPRIALILSMIAALVLGMALPTSAAYVVLASLAAPALIQMGFGRVQTHLFLFYFGVISCITPPVALAAYAGAGLAEADPMKTGFIAFRLGIAAYLIPFMFIHNPALLLIGHPREVLLAVPSAIIGAFSLAAASEGWFLTKITIIERLVLAGSAILLIKPGVVTDLIGLVLLIAIFVIQKRKQATIRGYEIGASN